MYLSPAVTHYQGGVKPCKVLHIIQPITDTYSAITNLDEEIQIISQRKTTAVGIWEGHISHADETIRAEYYLDLYDTQYMLLLGDTTC